MALKNTLALAAVASLLAGAAVTPTTATAASVTVDGEVCTFTYTDKEVLSAGFRQGHQITVEEARQTMQSDAAGLLLAGLSVVLSEQSTGSENPQARSYASVLPALEACSKRRDYVDPDVTKANLLSSEMMTSSKKEDGSLSDGAILGVTGLVIGAVAVIVVLASQIAPQLGLTLPDLPNLPL